MTSTAGRRKVLFIGEGSTLAHAARPMALAAALPSDRYEAILATPERYLGFSPPGVQWLPLSAQTPEAFAERLRQGAPVFSRALLELYVEQDLELIETVRPDVVVGDLRLSLAASARLGQVPYISVSNAYWSPDRPLKARRPSLDMFQSWPGPLADLAFATLGSLAMRRHASPVHRVMMAYELGGVGRDIRRAFTEADLTLFADLPALFGAAAAGPRRRFLGPVAWEPPGEPPAWWNAVPEDRPVAYLTLGSSGDGALTGRVAEWLVGLGFTVIAAHADRADLVGDGERLFAARFLPGSAAAARAELVVCNGGSPTATQALMAGRPVIGLAGNIDQFLNMGAVQGAGAGVTLRADSLTRRAFERAVARAMSPGVAGAAQALAASAQGWDPGAVLAEAIDELAPQ